MVVRQSAETALASNGAMLNGGASPRNDEQNADALVISLGVIVRDEFAGGLSQTFLSEQDHPAFRLITAPALPDIRCVRLLFLLAEQGRLSRGSSLPRLKRFTRLPQAYRDFPFRHSAEEALRRGVNLAVILSPRAAASRSNGVDGRSPRPPSTLPRWGWGRQGEKPNSSIFYVAYAQDDVADPLKRSVTFLYNGGWLSQHPASHGIIRSRASDHGESGTHGRRPL